MAAPSRPEPMNATANHSKVKVTLTLSDPIYVAGGFVTGKMEVECKMDKGLGLGVIMVELVAVEELTSRDHTAASTFLHSRRLFQGLGLPPSNAVIAHPPAGAPPLPENYYNARKGLTTFLFRLPLPISSPSAINFGSGLARVKYEIRASVAVAYKGENRLVTEKKELDVVESYEDDFDRRIPEGITVGEGGKMWMQATLVGGVVTAGQPACIQLQVKNHSTKKNSGLSLSLTRNLHFPKLPAGSDPPFQFSDTLITVPFKGLEYIIQPGSEGVANLVFDAPKTARGVKGGLRPGDEESDKTLEALFEIQTFISIKLAMGLGNKDIVLDLPVRVFHPLAMPTFPPDPEIYPPLPVPTPPYPHAITPPIFYSDPPANPYGYFPPYMSPSPQVPYMDPNQIWMPSDLNTDPYPYFSSPPPNQHYYYPPLPNTLIPLHSGMPMRPSSAEPLPSQPLDWFPPGFPPTMPQMLPQHTGMQIANNLPTYERDREPEEGKGERASRISLHLRMSSRARSVSPTQRRFPISAPPLSQHPLYEDSGQHLTQPIPIQSSTNDRASLHLSMRDIPSPSSVRSSFHSPRPMLSPKTSVTFDPMTKTVANKSERVEILEKMAEQADRENSDMSGTARHPRAVPRAGNDKTLPPPPVPSQKPVGGIGASFGRRKAQDVFSPVLSSSSGGAAAGSSPSLVPGSFRDRMAPISTEPEATPPTPALRAISPIKLSRSRGEISGLLVSSAIGSSGRPGFPSPGVSGLDALEAKLVAEVGTKKVEKVDVRPDVRTLLAMPMDIPTRGRRQSRHDDSIPEALRSAGVDDINDSAISSLTLAGEERSPMAVRDSDDLAVGEGGGGKTLRLSSRSRSKSRARTAGEEEVLDIPTPHKNIGEKKVSGGKKVKEEQKDAKGEGRKMRKSARGRIAAWLGSIDPDVPPPEVSTPPPFSPGRLTAPDAGLFTSSTSRPVTPKSPSVEAEKPVIASPPVQEDKNANDVAAAPNPRSSGFMPVKTLKAERVATSKEVRSDDGSTPRPPPAQLSPWLAKQEAKSPDPFPLKFGHNLAVKYPPTMDLAAKYDTRSARGGKGGKVTTVAAIWASTAQADGQVAHPKPMKPASSSPMPKKFDLGKVKASQGVISASSSSTEGEDKPRGERKKLPGVVNEYKRVRMAKSTSVPAVVSSSLAIPMISSSASLVRPGDPPPGRERPGKIPRSFGTIPTIEEDGGDNSTSLAGVDEGFGPGKGLGESVPKEKPELAFGQARLRDLIKKYQGGNS